VECVDCVDCVECVECVECVVERVECVECVECGRRTSGKGMINTQGGALNRHKQPKQIFEGKKRELWYPQYLHPQHPIPNISSPTSHPQIQYPKGKERNPIRSTHINQSLTKNATTLCGALKIFFVLRKRLTIALKRVYKKFLKNTKDTFNKSCVVCASLRNLSNS
jgi:hypothetical protein